MSATKRSGGSVGTVPGGQRPRRVTVAAILCGSAVLLSLAVCLWSMAQTPWRGAVPVPHAVSWLLVGVGAAAVVTAIVAGVDRLQAALAAALGLSVAAPWLAAGLHNVQPDDLLPLAMGTCVAAAVVAAPAVPPRHLRSAVLVVLALIMWASLLSGVAETAGMAEGALYERGGRQWLGVFQLSGIVGHPNGLGFLAALAVLLQSLAYRELSGRSLPVRVSYVVLAPAPAVAALLWSQSRTGWVALAVTGAALAAAHWFDRRAAGASLVPAAALGVVSLATFAPLLVALTGVSFRGRWFAWEVAWRNIAEHPLLGPGPWVFSREFWLAWPAGAAPPPWEPMHAHNQVLASAVYLGLVGVGVLVMAAVLGSFVAVRSRAADHFWAFAVMCVLFLMSGTELVLGVAGFAFTYPPVLVGATVLGAAWSLHRAGGQRSSPAPMG